MSGCITELVLEAHTLSRSETFRAERDRIVTDFLKHNQLTLTGCVPEEYHAVLGLHEGRLVLKLTSEQGVEVEVKLALSGLRPLIRDYHIICDSYFDAVRESDPRRVEAIDMGRRGMHDEGAERLKELLAPQMEMDFETARHVFALVAVLHRK